MNPAEAQTVKLGSLGIFLKGRGIRRTDVQSSGVPCLRYGEIYTRFDDYTDYLVSRVSSDVASTATRLRKGDIVFAGSGETKTEIGKCTAWIGDSDAVVGGDTIVLRGHGQDAVYLASLLNTAAVAKQKAARGQGDAVVHISARALSDIDVALPPLKVQTRVSMTIRDADALIASLERMIVKKQAIKQGVVQQLLTGKTRLPGFTDEWQNVTISSVAQFSKGMGLPKSAISENGNHPCIHYGELFTRYSAEVEFVRSRTNIEGSVVRSLANDVLMPTSDVTPRGLAKASAIMKKDVILGGDILVIRPDIRELFGPFLAHMIRFDANQVLKLVRGSTVFHIYANDMKNFAFAKPGVNEQREICAVLRDFQREIDLLIDRLKKARMVKKGIVQELLSALPPHSREGSDK